MMIIFVLQAERDRKAHTSTIVDNALLMTFNSEALLITKFKSCLKTKFKS